MSAIKELNNDIKIIISDAGYDVEGTVLAKTSRPDLGDFQINVALSLAKTVHKSPHDIANDIVHELQKDSRFTNINIAGPGFINISLTKDYLVKILNNINQDLSNNIDLLPPKKIILDYGGANVAKNLHVGHLRSANIGEALKRLARLLGYEVISDAHLGDYGRPLGLVILEIQKRYPNLPYFIKDYQGDYNAVTFPLTNKELLEIYPLASTKAKEDETYLAEGRVITQKIQNKERGYYELWQKIVAISEEEIKSIYTKLNVYFDLWEGESDSVPYIASLLEKLKAQNLLQESSNALIVDIKKDSDTAPMPPVIIVKSNDSVSYETTDLATIMEREAKYAPDEIWYCVDERQALHFKQVFRVARLAHLLPDNVKLVHIGFGTMNGADGKPFKTRAGGIMNLLDLINLVQEETYNRINSNIVKDENKNSTALDLAIATLKYTDLLPYRGTDYNFDISKFASLEGKTGPYLLYSTIRMKSLLNKSNLSKSANITTLLTSTEVNIALTIIDLPNVLLNALNIKSMNEISEYLYKLTSLYNKFYEENRILTEEDEDVKNSRLVLTKVVYTTNMLLLDVLGIKVPEKM